MGQRIATLVPKGSRIGLFIATAGQSNIQPRIDGAQSALKGKGYKIDVITTGADLPGELSKVDAYYQGHKDVKGLFAVDCRLDAGRRADHKKYGLAAKGVKGGGYDLLPITLDLIGSGDLEFTIDQQPYLQGFQPVISSSCTSFCGWADRAVEHEHRIALRDEGQRGSVSHDQVALRGQRQGPDVH